MSRRSSHRRRASSLRLAGALACASCFVDLGPHSLTAAETTGPDSGTTTGDTATGPEPVCGDGLVEPPELCDDGPLNGDYAACRSDCSPEICGDGLRGPSEACDGGDRCLPDCTPTRCGDGLVNRPDEQCDDGNADDTDACAHTCRHVGCGDGLLQDGEACDHGPLNADDAACTAACALASCGDGLLGPGEACDPGLPDPPCSETCALLSCLANTEPEPGEECQIGDEGCTDRCLLNECGDGFLGGEEVCDDGNLVSGDGCAPSCQFEVCGDGFTVPGEACDDGNDIAGDGCSPTCERDARYIFVTAETFSGAFGTLAVADQRCQDSADNALLPGTYRAWISFPGDPPAARLTRSDVPYILPGTLGEPVAADWHALVSGALLRPIDRTAAGEPLPSNVSCVDPAGLAWTHTRATGSPFPGSPCDDWLFDTGTAAAGLIHATDLAWTEGCPAVDCELELHLYCLEQ